MFRKRVKKKLMKCYNIYIHIKFHIWTSRIFMLKPKWRKIKSCEYIVRAKEAALTQCDTHDKYKANNVKKDVK